MEIDVTKISEIQATERMVMKGDGVGPDVTIYKGDPQFYPNSSNVFKYNLDFNLLKNLAFGIRDKKNVAGDMLKLLKSEPNITLLSSTETRDPNSAIFSHIEHAIFRNTTFDGFVEPSPGTITRWATEHKAADRKVSGMVVYVILPLGFPSCEQEVLDNYQAYKEHLITRATEHSYKLKIIETHWTELPLNKYLYFSHYGWRMHDRRYKGLGLELNPHVAASCALSVTSAVELDLCYELEYVKNNFPHKMTYVKKPVAYRIHAEEYLRMLGDNFSDNINLFNVVSSEWVVTTASVIRAENERVVHCSERICTPIVSGSIETVYSPLEEIRQHAITVALCNIDGVSRPVDIINPAYELSTRTMILEKMGLERPMYVTGDYSVLSSLRSVYVSFKDDVVKAGSYRKYLLPFPSLWFHNGAALVLRAYPKACRFSPTFGNSVFDYGNESYAPDKKGRWFYLDRGMYLPVPKYAWYDEELLINLSYGFFKSGVNTEFYEDTVVESVVPEEVRVKSKIRLLHKMARPFIRGLSTMVTVLKKKYLGVQYIPKTCGAGSIIFENDVLVVYQFNNVGEAHTFFLANADRLGRNMWYGDLNVGFDFDDPCNTHYALLPNSSIFAGSFMYKFPLKLSQMNVGVDNYDKIGNYVGESTGVNVYAAFDPTDDFVDDQVPGVSFTDVGVRNYTAHGVRNHPQGRNARLRDGKFTRL